MPCAGELTSGRGAASQQIFAACCGGGAAVHKDTQQQRTAQDELLHWRLLWLNAASSLQSYSDALRVCEDARLHAHAGWGLMSVGQAVVLLWQVLTLDVITRSALRMGTR